MVSGKPAEGNVLSQLPDVKIPEELFWEGDFGQYLSLISEDPKVLRTAHQRMFDMVESYGLPRSRWLREPILHFNIFDDPFTPNHNYAVYSIDKALMSFVGILRASAFQLGQEARIILLKGPVGTAKSTIGELLTLGLEDYSRTQEGKIFAPTWVVDDEEGQAILGTVDRLETGHLDCPVNDQPLRIIPKELRKEILSGFLSEAQKNMPYPLALGGSTCPRCNGIFQRLLRRYRGDWKKVLANHFKVRRIVLSRANRVGIAITRPKAEKDQDATEWTGETNYVLLAKFGSVSDERTFDFKGFFQVANRGMLYSEELLKLSQSFLYDYLGASQEHRVQPKGFVEVDIDEVIIGGTNLPEWTKLKETKEMEALRDRIISVNVPYVLQLSGERKIYQKFFVEGNRGLGRHIAPHTIDTAAFWAILTRLTEIKKGDLSLADKLKLYDGREVPGYNIDSIKELVAEAGNEGKEELKEGMKGVSPRYTIDKIANAISNVFSLEGDKNCVNFFVVLKELKEGLRQHQHITSDSQRESWEKLINMAEEELQEILKNEVQQILVGDVEALREMHQKYIDNILAYKQGERIRNPITGEDEPPDEPFMRAIEKMIRVEDNAKDVFREKILNAMVKRARERELDSHLQKFDYNTDERLMKAYQLRLFEQEKDRINWEALISKKAVGEEAQKRINFLKDGLIKKGYCQVCSAEVITYVASIFKRGEAAKKR
ncbi:MAG: serine protein kinase [Candidatus Nealsonbacteria bacterium]|nr:serine protein kinase [Candidatus Nealsonbacteria bacterium]